MWKVINRLNGAAQLHDGSAGHARLGYVSQSGRVRKKGGQGNSQSCEPGTTQVLERVDGLEDSGGSVRSLSSPPQS